MLIFLRFVFEFFSECHAQKTRSFRENSALPLLCVFFRIMHFMKKKIQIKKNCNVEKKNYR